MDIAQHRRSARAHLGLADGTLAVRPSEGPAGAFQVCSGESEYQVNQQQTGWQCTCPDFEQRCALQGWRCKHIEAVRLTHGAPEPHASALPGALVTASFRHTAKVGNDYLTVELGATLPDGAQASEIEALLARTGSPLFQALAARVTEYIQSRAASQHRLARLVREIKVALRRLQVPPSLLDDAIGQLGEYPHTEAAAQALLTLIQTGRMPGDWQWGKPLPARSPDRLPDWALRTANGREQRLGDQAAVFGPNPESLP